MLMALVPLLSRVLGSTFVELAADQIMKQYVQNNLSGAIEQFLEESGKLIGDVKWKVLSVDSDNWYLFNLINQDNWKKGLDKFAEKLQRDIIKPYTMAPSTSGEGVQFTVHTDTSERELNIQLVKTPMSQGFNREEALHVVRDVVRKNLKGYFRSIIAGGADLPEEVE